MTTTGTVTTTGEDLVRATGRVAQVAGLTELRRHLPALAALWEDSGAPIYARATAIEAWSRHRPRERIWAPVLYDPSGEARAAAILTRGRRLGRYRIGFPGQPSEPTHLAARDAASAADLAVAIRVGLDRLGHPWTLYLRDLPSPDPVVTTLRAELANVEVSPGPDAPGLDLRAGGHVSRNTRSAVAKAVNRISREGHAMRIGWTSDPAGVAAVLPEVVSLHTRRNLQVRGRAALADRHEERLFTATTRAFAADGCVELLTLRIDQDLAAFALCLADRPPAAAASLSAPPTARAGGGVLRVHANLVSPDWLRYSAGTIANAEVVRHASAAGYDWLDWGAGVARYKMSGNATLRHTQTLRAWSSGALRVTGRLVHRG